MNENDKTVPAFFIMTAILTVILYFGADVSGVAGVIVSVLVSATIAIVIIGAMAIGKNLSK